MRHQDKMKIQRRRRRKLFWLFAAAAVGALLFEEQVAVLYALSTLAVCGLMIVVAFSNLEARDAEMQRAQRKDCEPRLTPVENKIKKNDSMQRHRSRSFVPHPKCA